MACSRCGQSCAAPNPQLNQQVNERACWVLHQSKKIMMILLITRGKGDKMQLDPSGNAMQENAKKVQKKAQLPKKFPHLALKKVSGAFDAGMKMS